MRRISNLGRLPRTDVPQEHLAIQDLAPGGRCWSYGALDAAANAAGALFLSRGISRGSRIGILAANSAEYAIAYLGAMRAGLVAVPINYRLPEPAIAHIFADSGIALCLADAEHASRMPAGVERMALADLAKPAPGGAALPDIALEPGEIAEILYTSGSTGMPKGVPLSHDGQIWALNVHVPATAALGERSLVAAPLYHMNALFFVSVALASGMQLALMPRFEPRAYLHAVENFRPTRLGGIPTMFAMMARETDLLARLDLSSVQRLSVGSAPLTEALVERIKAIFPDAALSNGYGTTEAGPSIFADHPGGLPRPLLSVGYPVAGAEVRLSGGADPDQGVLEVRTPALMASYLNLAAQTAEKIRDGWFVSGDVMRRDDAGFYYFVGRADDMFVCGGENLYPGEIEKMLERHPGVAQAAVMPVPDEIRGEIPIAFVVPTPGTCLDTADLKRFALSHGPAYAHPRAFVVVDRLPLSGTHKIDKTSLLPQALEVARRLNR